MFDKLEKVDWALVLTVESFGVIFQIRTDKNEFCEQIISWLPAAYKLSSNKDVDFVLSFVVKSKQVKKGFYRNHELITHFETSAPEHLENVLKTKILFSIAEYSQAFTFLHAGAVALNEKAILIIGASHSGKTTLTADFVRSGAKYFTDDCVVIDSEVSVHPLPKPLSIRNEVGIQTDIEVETLGGQFSHNQLSIALLLFVEYNSKAVWKPRKLSVGETTFKLMQNVFYSQSVRKNPSKIMFNLQQIAKNAVAFEGKRSGTHEVIDFTRELVCL